VQKHAQFDKTVTMWVFEEMVDGKKLSEIINTTHENVKYLPGKTLPSNVVRVGMIDVGWFWRLYIGVVTGGRARFGRVCQGRGHTDLRRAPSVRQRHLRSVAR
jgi:hypothetical protein